MSLKTVQLVAGRLITDEDFRIRYLADPRRTLAQLLDQGFELTAGEVDALLRTDPALWTDAASRLDPELQKCRLRG